VIRLFSHLVIGWPAYLLIGATGGPKYGTSNHFWPFAPFSKSLWPNKWPRKVGWSSLGIGAVVAALGAWASKAGSLAVFALYGAPLMVTNMWLVLYTWLQHTDVDVPHLTANEFSFMRGAFLTIDRPYGRVLDWLHHRIGSTHVAHHIDCTIPHYHAAEATEAIAKAFPKAYLYDPTPIHKAAWRVAADCVAVQKQPEEGKYVWVRP
jgi:fatty acid desaturase